MPLTGNLTSCLSDDRNFFIDSFIGSSLSNDFLQWVEDQGHNILALSILSKYQTVNVTVTSSLTTRILCNEWQAGGAPPWTNKVGELPGLHCQNQIRPEGGGGTSQEDVRNIETEDWDPLSEIYPDNQSQERSDGSSPAQSRLGRRIWKADRILGWLHCLTEHWPRGSGYK